MTKRSAKRTAFGDAAKLYGKAAAGSEEEIPIEKAPTTRQRRIRSSDSTTTPSGLVQRSVYVDPNEWVRVLNEADRLGLTAAEVVRRALRAYLKED